MAQIVARRERAIEGGGPMGKKEKKIMDYLKCFDYIERSFITVRELGIDY